MSTAPASLPVDERTELQILDDLIRRFPLRQIARTREISAWKLRRIGDAAGYPDREKMRRRAADLRESLRRQAVEEEAADDGAHPAVTVAWNLAAALRDLDVHPFLHIVENSTPQQMVELLMAFAAAVDPSSDPCPLLEWIDLPAEEWSPGTVRREAGRWLAGARDRTAVTAREQARAWEQTQV